MTRYSDQIQRCFFVVGAPQADSRDDVTKRENRGTSNLQGKKAENMLQFGFANTAVTVSMLHLEAC